MKSKPYFKTLTQLYGKNVGDAHYWVSQNKIPIGSLKPYESKEYWKETPEGMQIDIPKSDIVTLSFDPVDLASTKRRAFNNLLLAGSGDGKSLLMKVMWSVLHEAGYRIVYIDPKSTDSGRARKAWNSARIPPYMQPKGIKLEHYMPIWATDNFEHKVHNFKVYSARLTDISTREMWQGLGMTAPAASKVAKILDKNNQVTVNKIKTLIRNPDNKDDELTTATINNVMRVLTDIEDYELISKKRDTLDLDTVWKKKESVSICISYNKAQADFMTFDIGMRIRQANLYKRKSNDYKPIMFFFDDASLYADYFKHLEINFAVHEIINIGNIDRSLGLYNTLAVQSLGIIDDNVAETYRNILISPYFANVESLRKIGIPEDAIKYIKTDSLVRDKPSHTVQWLFVDEDKNITPFFPFTPPCNHFDEVYFSKQEEQDIQAEVEAI